MLKEELEYGDDDDERIALENVQPQKSTYSEDESTPYQSDKTDSTEDSD